MVIPIKRETGGNATIDAQGQRFTLGQVIDWVNDQGQIEKELKEAKELAEKNRTRYEKAETDLAKLDKRHCEIVSAIHRSPKWKHFLMRKHVGGLLG